MALGSPGTEVWTVDIDCDPLVFVAVELAPNLHFIHADSVDAAKLFRAHSVDFLFVDTKHTYEQTKAEYQAWYHNVKMDGLIVFDDYEWSGVGKLWQEIGGVQVHYPKLGGHGGNLFLFKGL